MSHYSVSRNGVLRLVPAVVFAGMALMCLLSVSPAAAQTCDVAGYAACNYSNVGRLYARSVYLTGGSSVVAEVTNLVNANGSTPADPMLIVTRWDSAAVRERIVAYDDDSSPSSIYAPRVTFTAPVSGSYSIYVVNSHTANSGSGTLGVTQAGQLLVSETVTFGSHSKLLRFLANDELLATKSSLLAPSGTTPDYANTRLLALDVDPGGNCQSGSCGWAWFNDNDIGLLSRANPDLSPTGASRIFVGSASNATLHLRLYHLRRHWADGGVWSLTDTRDLDGDGLPRELENVLGTCDASSSPGNLQVHVGTTSCSAMRTLVNAGLNCDAYDTLGSSEDSACWTPVDSDNDGMSDLEEIYGTRRCYDQAPEPGRGYVGGCKNTDGDQHCDVVCTGTRTYELPLSAMDSVLDPPAPTSVWRPVSPVHFDVLVDQIYNHSTGQGQGQSFSRRLAEMQFRQIHYTFEEEPAECALCPAPTCKFCPTGQADFCRFGTCCDPDTQCPGDDRFMPRIHLYETAMVLDYDVFFGGEQKVGNIGGSATAHARFDFVANADRRYTNAFRFGALDGGSGGQAVYGRRAFAFGALDNFGGRTFTHELGHSLDLWHNGDGKDATGIVLQQADYVNYPSVMSCFAAAQPLKTSALSAGTWNGVYPTCSMQAHCNAAGLGYEYFECVQTQDENNTTIGRCLPRTFPPDSTLGIWPWRYSRGTISMTYDERNDVDEFDVPHTMWLHYTSTDGPCASVVESSWELHRIRRFFDTLGQSRGVCNTTTCFLDLNRLGTYTSNAAPTDVNRNGQLDGTPTQPVQPVVHDDHNDWRAVVRKSKRSQFRHDAFHTVYRDTPIYWTGFNAPASFHDVNGECDATCDAQARASNMLGWQPTTVTGTAVTFPEIYNGDYGHFARFYGPGTDSHITLSAHPRFEALAPDSQFPGFGYGGFRFRAWVRPSVPWPATGQTWHGLVSNGLFTVLLWRDPNTSAAAIWVWLQKGSSGAWHSFSMPTGWLVNEQRSVEVEFDGDDNLLTVRVSNAVGFGSNGNARDDATTSSLGTLNVSGAVDGTVGDVSLGAAPNYTLYGWMDDVVFYAL